MLNKQDVRELLELNHQPILSLYLNIDPADAPNQATTPAWRIWLKNALRDLGGKVATGDADLWKRIAAQVETHLSQFRAESKGYALFVGSSLLREYALPLPVENRIEFGAPLVTPLIWLIDEYERYLIVLVDQEQAYFFTAYFGQIGQQDQLEIDIEDYDWVEKTRGTYSAGGTVLSQGGNNRDSFDAMIEEHRARYYRDVAAHVEELAKQHSANRIVLGGSEPSAHAVQRYLHEKTAQKVIGVLPIPMRNNSREVLDRVLPTALEYERQYETKLVDEVINFAKAEGRGALGKKAVYEALEMQRVETLIVPYPIQEEAFSTELPLKALASNSDIELVHGEAADRLKQEGGLAARLYYAL